MISNCGHDENNKYSNGKAGDQTGAEWKLIPWYNKPWKAVFRHPNDDVRERIAQNAEKAANNDNVGYDQYQRTTYWDQLSSVNFNAAAITVPCEADCSSGVAANVKAAGYICNDSKLKNVPATMWTGNAEKILKNAGFKMLTDSKYLTSDANLVRGDILFIHDDKLGKHHMAVNVTNNNTATTTDKKATTNNSYAVIVKVNSVLNCRTAPSMSGKIVTQFKNGTELTITEESNGWGHCSKGWVSLNWTVRK